MTKARGPRASVSLFSGAGGMDVGFARAGFESVLACEIDHDACQTFNLNLHAVGHHGNRMECSSVTDLDLSGIRGDIDAVFGGPPCQGFSVAGKMDPDDDRSRLMFSFFEVVDRINPKGFVCENVKALAVSSRWESVRRSLLRMARKSHRVALIILNAVDFGVPQVRERMFLVGIRKDIFRGDDRALEARMMRELASHHCRAPTVGDVVRYLGKAGTRENPKTCTAKISYSKAPILRRSPYAGMIFNGAGRPLPAGGFASTLPASMGGNRTPIVDEDEILNGKESFVESYHAALMDGGEPRTGSAPARLRRLTIKECMAIQTFPADYRFHGRKSSVYRQIGNAVPCDLARAIARSFNAILDAHESIFLHKDVA